MNFTDINRKLANTAHLVGVSPRWLSFAVLSKTSDYLRNSSTVALVVNSTQEAKIGLGRRWNHKPLVGRTCHITGSLMRFLDIKSGDNVSVSIDTIDMMATAAGYGSNSTAFVIDTLRTLTTTDPLDPELQPYFDLPPDIPTVAPTTPVYGDDEEQEGEEGEPLPGPLPKNPLSFLFPPGTSPRMIKMALSLAGIDVDGIIEGRVPLDILGLKRTLTTRQSFIVKEPIGDQKGKYPSALGNVVLLEADAVQTIVRELLHELRNGNLNAVFPHLPISPALRAYINFLLGITNDPPTAEPFVRQPTPPLPSQVPPSIQIPPSITIPPNILISPASVPPGVLPPPNSPIQMPPDVPPQYVPLFSLPPDISIPPAWQLPPGTQFTPDNQIILPPLPPMEPRSPETLAPNLSVPPSWWDEYGRYNNTINNRTRDFYMGDYALLVVGMNTERFSWYSMSKNELDAKFLEWTNTITLKLGLDYQVTLTTPLGKMLGLLYYLRLVLDQMLLIVELFLIALGCYLIYSLLLSDVESKVYESGMLRALGMQQKTLVALLSLQSLLFSIPGLSFGLFVAFLFWQPIRAALVHFVATPVPIGLNTGPILMGAGVGLLMPLVALIGPVMKSLSKTLRDSLDLYHSAVNDTLVTVTKLESLGLSPGQTWAALLMVVFGFIVYYLAPLSFIFLNLPLFFTIFVVILAGMLIGLSLLAMLLHSTMQQLVMHSIMWFSDARKLKPLVRKNLHGHSARNRKTAVLFTTCIAFIIFAGSIFQLQSNNITATIEITVGSDIVVATFSSNPANKIDEEGITKYLEAMKQSPNSPIVEYGFSTFSLNDLKHVGYARLGNLAEIPTRRALIYGVSKNFLNSVYDKYVVVSDSEAGVKYQKTRAGKVDIIESLFSTPTVANPYGSSSSNGNYFPEVIGTNNFSTKTMSLTNEYIYRHNFPVIISKALTGPLSVDVSSPIATMIYPIAKKIGRHLDFNEVYGLVQPRAIVSKVPGFFYSSYQQTSNFAPILVSETAYDHLRYLTLDNSYMAGEKIEEVAPKRAVFVRLKESADSTTRQFIGNGLRNYVTNDLVQVLDARQLVIAISAAVWVLYIFSNIVAFLVQLLCFFTLLVSFTSNINENAWEFGVLRSMGLTSFQVIRLYIYEASCIIIASVFLGCFVGLSVAITLTLQADLFSELPFKMEFPVFLFCSIVTMSVVTAFLSSYIPSRTLGARRIASVLKGK